MSCDYFSSLCLALLMIIVSYAELARGSRDDCIPSPFCEQMSNKSLEYPSLSIEFPFRLRNFQPGHCSLPGFELSCTTDNKTVLDLPNSATKLYVTFIDYISQELQVKIPDYHRSSEVRQSLELLNLSLSPFRFKYKFSHLAMMNCSGQAPWINDINPMSDANHGSSKNSEIYAIDSRSHIEDSSLFVNCTKMYSCNPPADLTNPFMDSFQLTWQMPSLELAPEPESGADSEYFEYEQSKGQIKSILTGVSTVGSLLVLVAVIVALYYYTLDKKEKENRLRIEKFLEDYIAFKPSRYNYSDIKKITDHFKVKLGQGAYGTVFKGKLSSDILVAVKILNNNATTGKGEEFINEVATMGRIHHINVVRLVGYCADGFRRALVYDFLPNYSLEKYISPATSSTTNQPLSWLQLQGIALGVAKGIDYLHQGCDQRILHFDIKPHNILLDHNFTPKICDFGLAKLCSKDQSIVSMTMTRGTIGYIAPEVFSRNFGNVSYKSDVYSFGMLLLEMVAGRKNTGGEEESAEEIHYPEWIYNLLEEGEDLRIQIDEEGDSKIAKRLAIVGLWCIQWHPAGRPTMKLAVQMLEGEGELKMPPNPFASTGTSNTTTKIPARRIAAFELEAIAE